MGKSKRRFHRFSGATLSERFWAKVNKDGPAHPYDSKLGRCWLWTASASTNANGTQYGTIRHKGQTMRAPRVAYQLAHGEVPAGKQICHSCDRGLCVNDAHLFAGTHSENMADRDAKGRQVRFVGSKHPQAKLNEWAVKVIRALRQLGYKPALLGPAFGVSPEYIWLVTARKIWKHVA